MEDGVEGEIVVRLDQGHPAGLLREYYRDPVKTAEVFRGGMYHTGDMAWRDVDGYYLFHRPQRRRHQVQRLPHRPL